MAVSLQSYNQILGKLARKIIADTPVNDLNPGSVLLTLLEAVAAQDFENSASILSVLETLNIDALKNSDLDARAADYGLSRKTSAKATGFIKIYDTSFVKRATSLYAVKPPPIAGTNIVYVNDASGWSPTGQLFIGRGTPRFEGPINYSSIENNGSFYKIILDSNLKKDHLISDVVVDQQGTFDRFIPSGTVIKIPSNNLNPEIRYITLRDTVIPAGEDTIVNVAIVAENAGASSNAGINSIILFDTLPFASAAVTNTSVLSDGADEESDDDLRERLKNYSATLSRGTRASILSAIVGVSDPTDGKQVSSAVIQEPSAYGEPSIVYIDDGSGFQPTTNGQSVDVLLASAAGGEQFLQLSNFPLPRPQIYNQTSGPIEMQDGMRLVVSVDEVEEEIIFRSAHFNNISAATLIEIVLAINTQANDNNYQFRCRLAESSTRLLIYPTKYNAEFIQISSTLPIGVVNANTALQFPVNKYSYISLYKNNQLLRVNESPAALTTTASPWTEILTGGDLVISVDGTPAQTANFSLADFDGIPFSAVSPAQWAAAMNRKFAGITASATSNGKIQIKSNKTGVGSSLEIIGGDYADDWFSGERTYDEGQASDFAINRQTGNIKLTVPASPGDSITAGNVDAKGYLISTSTNTGAYDLTEDSDGRPSEMVIVSDGSIVDPKIDIFPAIGSELSIDTSGAAAGHMRVVSNSVATFQNAKIDDYIYLVKKADDNAGWFSPANYGLYKIVKKGKHLNAGVDSWLEVVNIGASDQSGLETINTSDIQVFESDVYPQLWKSSYVSSTAPITIQQMINSFSADLLNVNGSVFKTNSVKVTSTTENDGSIAIPVSTGKLSLIFATQQEAQKGNQSHIATRLTSGDLFTWFKRGAYEQRSTSNSILEDRSRYSDLKGSLSSNAEPQTTGQYGETLTSTVIDQSLVDYDDLINVTTGSNKSIVKTIKEFTGANEIGSKRQTPSTVFDYLSGDEIQIIKSLSFSSTDSMVCVIDGDAINKTINVNFWRTGRVSGDIAPTNSQFSAFDADNESGVKFSNQTVWSTSGTTNTNFEDYAVWFRSRNWYRSEGASSSKGTLILRAKEYGPTGDLSRFSIDYPANPLTNSRVEHINNPEHTKTTFYFESGEEITTGINTNSLFSVKKIEKLQVVAEGSGLASGDYFILYSSNTTALVFWYDIDNAGTSQPSLTPPAGVTYEYVKISNIVTGDSAQIVAQKTSQKIDSTDMFVSTYLNSTVDILNNFNGSVPAGEIYTNLSFTLDQDTNLVRYKFQGLEDFSQVEVGNILSILDEISVSAGNSGTFRIERVSSSGAYLDVYNPSASPTSVGSVAKYEISLLKPAGVKKVQQVTTTAVGAGSGEVSSGDYFTLNDSDGSIVFWYDVNAAGTAQPTVAGAFRFVKIDTIITGDTADSVAEKTSAIVDADISFSSSYASGSVFEVTNDTIGDFNDGSTPNSASLGFTFTEILAGESDTLGGKYFRIFDKSGSVAVWFNVDGSTIPPHGSLRSIQVSLEPGDSATTVGEKISLTLDGDAQFVSYYSSGTVYISNYENGERLDTIDGSSPYSTAFTFNTTSSGSVDIPDAPTSSSGISIFPIISNDVETIASVINTSETMTAAVVGDGSLTIDKATKEETESVSYLHDVDPLNGSNDFVRMFDGESFIRDFSNFDPNFVLKKDLVLQGQQPTIYNMSSCPNPQSDEAGEFFKLIPKTVQNVKHHLTHKALSQLPIVADVSVSGKFNKIQIKSKKLGTQGGVEIIGGRANSGELDLIGSAGSIENDTATENYLVLNTSAFPSTLNKGDMVKIYNTLPSKRKFSPDNNTKVEVETDASGAVRYLFGGRNINYSPFTRWTISDVSGSYLAQTGTIWRWQHKEGGANVKVSGRIDAYEISDISVSSNVATISTSSVNNFEAGQKILISNQVDVPSLNREWIISTVIDTDTFEVSTTGVDDVITTGGSVVSVATQETPPSTYSEDGTEISERIRFYSFENGNSTTPFSFYMTVDSTPTQGDFFIVRGPQTYDPVTELEDPAETYAIWFDVEGDGTAPSAVSFTSSTYQIQVSILSSYTPNEIVEKISSTLETNTDFKAYLNNLFISGTNLNDAKPGDVVDVWPSTGDSHLLQYWPMGNQSRESGSLKSSGMPVINVNASSRYMDVINPQGRAMTDVFTSITGNMRVSPTIMNKFRLKHSSYVINATIGVKSGIATVTCKYPHGFSVGDSVTVFDSLNTDLDTSHTITETPSLGVFKFNVATTDVTAIGNIKLTSDNITRYRIRSLGFNNFFKIEYAGGDNPRFSDCGICVDDFVEISGNTFDANNRGRFRIRAVDNNSIIVQDDRMVEELHTKRLANYLEKPLTWTSGSDIVTGNTGAFRNVVAGTWVRSVNDTDEEFVQVSEVIGVDSASSTEIRLAQTYKGASGSSMGLVIDFETDVNQGVELLNEDDIKIYECDSVNVNDSLIIDAIANPSWFNKINAGLFSIIDWGTDDQDRRQYVKISNVNGLNQQQVSLSVNTSGVYILEKSTELYETIRQVENTSINKSYSTERLVYATPNDRTYKMSSEYGTKISSLGKMNFPLGIASGIDGYSYYTGLMQTVQRIIDGYEPDIDTYPGRRAVGSSIECIPPLIRQISMVLRISTKEGVNLNDITNDIKSTIISYISSLGVGEDVVLSEIIRRVKDITGVDAVTFTTPQPSLERIPVFDNEKALTAPDLISLS